MIIITRQQPMPMQELSKDEIWTLNMICISNYFMDQNEYLTCFCL